MWIYSALSFLVWPIIIIGLIWFFVRRKKQSVESKDKNIAISFSREDTVSQWFLLLSVFFLGITLLALNRDFGNPFSWRLILFVTCIVGFVISYYFKAISTLIVTLLGIAGWWALQAVDWNMDKDIKNSSILFGMILIFLLFYLLGNFHEKQLKYNRFALVYTVFGIILTTVSLFFFSSQIGLGMLSEMTKGVPVFSSWQLTMSLVVFFSAIVLLTLYLVSKKIMLLPEAGAVLFLAVLFGCFAFLPQQHMFLDGFNYYSSQRALSSTGVLWAVVFNFTVFFEMLGLIFSGYLRREEWLINIGTFFLFILIIVKYFDWFFTFFDKSLFFIGAGILLFVVGWFMEKSRRYVISTMKSEQKS